MYRELLTNSIIDLHNTQTDNLKLYHPARQTALSLIIIGHYTLPNMVTSAHHTRKDDAISTMENHKPKLSKNTHSFT